MLAESERGMNAARIDLWCLFSSKEAVSGLLFLRFHAIFINSETNSPPKDGLFCIDHILKKEYNRANRSGGNFSLVRYPRIEAMTTNRLAFTEQERKPPCMNGDSAAEQIYILAGAR